MTDASRRLQRGELCDEVDGSSDTCAWVQRSELASLPLVELAEVGIRLAGFADGRVGGASV